MVVPWYAVRSTVVLSAVLLAGCRAVAQPVASRAPRATPVPLLDRARIAALPDSDRVAWERYLARSDSARRRDRAPIDAELRTIGRATMDSAPFVKDDFGTDTRFRGNWWRSADAAALGDVLLSYQTATGGWSKHVDYAKGARRPGMSYFGESTRWQYIATLDNHATTAQLHYLLALQRAQPAEKWAAAITRGIEWLEAAQMPNGCWPQVWPLDGSYHDAITFNDDAVAEAARVLSVLADSSGPWLAEPLRQRARTSAERAVHCLLRAQVVLAGRRTIWGQQHDPLTLAPTQGRSYELPSLATAESAGILDFLITRPRTPALVEAVRDAAQWLRAHVLRGLEYEQDRGPTPAPPEAQLWARLYTLDTGVPLFANRDGVPRLRFEELTDRRTGYNWYGTWPRATLARIDAWLSHP